MSKRILIIGDMHCGHLTGLTPPPWQIKRTTNSSTKRNKWADLSHELWIQYKAILRKLGPFDFGFSMGDLIDGPGKRSGGVELISTDRNEQADMAVAVHDQVRLHANRGFKWVGVYGTAYHSGDEEDWETAVAKDAGFEKIGSHEWPMVNGVTFDLKHHISTSTIPHGRFTGIARDKLWNSLWAEVGNQPKADIMIRGHAHYALDCGQPGWRAIINPALQGMGTKFGSRRCSGTVHWGVTIIDILKDKKFEFHQEVIQIEAQKAKVIKLS